MPSKEWEIIAEHTSRLQVPGGWLYRVLAYDGTGRNLALTFVPNPDFQPTSAFELIFGKDKTR